MYDRFEKNMSTIQTEDQSILAKFLTWFSSASSGDDNSTSIATNWIKVGERSLLIFLLANFILKTFTNRKENDQSLFKSITMSLANSKVGQKLIGSEIEKEVKKSVSEMFKTKAPSQRLTFPEKASSQAEIEQYLQSLKELDAKTKEGKVFAFVYHLSEGHDEFVTKMHNMFIVSFLSHYFNIILIHYCYNRILIVYHQWHSNL